MATADPYARLNTDVADQVDRLDTQLAQSTQQHEDTMARLRQQSLTHADQMVETQRQQTQLESAPLPERGPDVPMPKPPNIKEMFDEKQYQGLAMGLLAMALVGGSRGSDSWYMTSAALNGALKGFHEGQTEKANDAYKDYETKYKAAVDQQKAYDKRYDDVLNNRNKTIAQKLSEIKLIAAEQGRDDIRTAAETKQFDTMVNQINTHRDALMKLEGAEAAVQTRKKTAEATHAINSAGGGTLNENGNWLVQQTMLGGNTEYAKMVMSRYGAKMAAPMLNELGKNLKEAGVDPRNLTAEKLTLAADKANLTAAQNRVAAVERLTGSVQSIEQKALGLVADLNRAGVPEANQTVNYFRRKFGNQDLAEMQALLRALATQYQEAITMPGSNAQMHATTLESALSNINSDMPLSTFVGALKGMNFEMNATRQALHKQVDDISKGMRTQGPTIPVPGGGAPAAGGDHPDDIKNLLGKYGK